jgi:hypothetical protein
MPRFRILCFLSISGFIWQACSPLYKKLHRVAGDPSCIQQFRPVFPSVLYSTQVDVAGRHLSGLLLIKTMPDSSIRVVFSSAFGPKFFDFEFPADTGFQVRFIIPQLDKKAVVKTLRKDFELILFRGTHSTRAYVLGSENYHYYAFPQPSGTNYYLTDTSCKYLIRAEKASQSKVISQAVMKDYQGGVPDSIGISHNNFNFTIGLKRLMR